MASLHPLPSTRGKRLLELLEEQQEPFMLDVCLKENGHSERLLSPRSMCWPWSACKRLHKMAIHGFRKRRRRRGGLLFKCVLNKCLRENSIRKALRWDAKTPPDSRTIGKSCSSTDIGISKLNADDDDDEEEEEEEEASDLQFSSTTCSVSEVSDEEAVWKCLEEEAKLHSPMSVLCLDSRAGSPTRLVQNISREGVSAFSLELQRKALDIFEELLQVAYTPAFDEITKVDLPQPDRHQNLRSKEAEVSVVDSHGRSKLSHGLIHDEVTIGRLAADQLSNSWKNWMHFQPQLRDSCIRVDDAIFECVLEETVLEMLTSFSCTFVES